LDLYPTVILAGAAVDAVTDHALDYGDDLDPNEDQQPNRSSRLTTIA
jgi:hypothetical protein